MKRIETLSREPGRQVVGRERIAAMMLRFRPSLWSAWVGVLVAAAGGASAADYAVLVSGKTQSDPAWQQVATKLREKHAGVVLVHDGSVEEALPKLRELFPRYACILATPGEVTREFVASVHRVMRQLDEDPYPDCFWGILTGYDATNALRIAEHQEPLTVRKVASGTEVALDMCEEGVWYSELKAGLWFRKEKGSKPGEYHGPADSTEPLAKTLTDYHADLFVTSGHATERDWQIGYSYRNGSFRCEQGRLYGLDVQKQKHPIQSSNPKVYLPVGNCLMGHIDGPEAMALAFLNSGGVNQMIGYTVPSWYGYAGWGCLDYFVEQPSRYTFAEAFFANQAALIHRLHIFFPDLVSAELNRDFRPKTAPQVSDAARAAGLRAQDALGLLYDRDTVAFYGDPAWEARMADQPKAFHLALTWNAGRYVFEIKPNRGADSFKPINTNGSQRGGRPMVAWLPHRVSEVKLIEGEDLKPVITDNFILVPNPRQCDPARPYRVVFQAKQRE